MSTDSEQVAEDAPTARPGRREQLIAVASDLVYRHGIARTTLADLAQAANMQVGNLYYYFKTKDDIIRAVVQAHAAQITSAIAELERRHRSPKARLKALVKMLAGTRDLVAQFGCRYGTLASELAKRAEGSDRLATPLMQIPLDWVERQFRAMGRHDAYDLAEQLVATYQGSAVLSSALGEPGPMARQARRLERWIDALDA